MQRALIQQIVSAVDTKYLSALRNRVTGQLPNDIRAILLYLFRVYGKIKPEYLQERKAEVENLTFTLSDPIDTIFNQIEDLAELGELSARPFSDTQLTDFTFIIANKNRAFREDIRTWIRKTAVDQTFANF